jgi:hypothetical protein
VTARLVAAAAVAVLVALAACSSDRDAGPAPTTRLAEPGDAIDQQLMISLGQAKNYHHKAKIYMTDGNLTSATAAVREILSLRFPRGAAEADDVRNDARALLAKLLVSQGQLEEASRTIEEGLAQSQRESFFVANLYTVQGEIHQARAAALGDGDEAQKVELRAAIASFNHSIQINDRLQKKLMEER